MSCFPFFYKRNRAMNPKKGLRKNSKLFLFECDEAAGDCLNITSLGFQKIFTYKRTSTWCAECSLTLICCVP